MAVFGAAWAHSLYYEAGIYRSSEWIEPNDGSNQRCGRGFLINHASHGLKLLAYSYTVPGGWRPGWSTGGANGQWFNRVGPGSQTAWWFTGSVKDGHTVGWPDAGNATFPGLEIEFSVPYWSLILAGLAGALFCGRSQLRRLKGKRGGRCSNCNYDRTGLAPDAVCPECGKASEDQKAII